MSSKHFQKLKEYPTPLLNFVQCLSIQNTYILKLIDTPPLLQIIKQIKR